MSMALRAEDVPATSRAEYWQQAVGEMLGPLEVRHGGPDARDRLRIGDAGALRVAELTTVRSGGADRTRNHIRRSDPDVCKIDVLHAMAPPPCHSEAHRSAFKPHYFPGLLHEPGAPPSPSVQRTLRSGMCSGS
jgi:hypothetical protein